MDILLILLIYDMIGLDDIDDIYKYMEYTDDIYKYMEYTDDIYKFRNHPSIVKIK